MAIKLTHERVDLNKCLAANHDPQTVIHRGPSEVWLVSEAAISLATPIRWGRFQRETHVRIPLVPYLLNPQPDMALAFCFSLGLHAQLSVGPISRIHIVTGVPVSDGSDDPEGRLRYWIGFGVVLKN